MRTHRVFFGILLDAPRSRSYCAGSLRILPRGAEDPSWASGGAGNKKRCTASRKNARTHHWRDCSSQAQYRLKLPTVRCWSLSWGSTSTPCCSKWCNSGQSAFFSLLGRLSEIASLPLQVLVSVFLLSTDWVAVEWQGASALCATLLSLLSETPNKLLALAVLELE